VVTKTALTMAIAATASLAVGVGALASASDQHSTEDQPFSLLSPSMYGVDNFHSYCSPCHGRDGKGGDPCVSLRRR